MGRESFENGIKAKWSEQMRSVESSLGALLVDDFSIMIDEIKLGLRENLQERLIDLRNKLDELLQRRESFFKNKPY